MVGFFSNIHYSLRLVIPLLQSCLKSHHRPYFQLKQIEPLRRLPWPFSQHPLKLLFLPILQLLVLLPRLMLTPLLLVVFDCESYLLGTLLG